MKPDWRDRGAALAGLSAAFIAIEAVLVGKIDPQETPVGILLAILAAGAAVGALAAAGDRFAPALSMLAGSWKVAASVVTDTLVVTAVLFRALRGTPPADTFVELPLDACGDDPRAAAARALAVTSASAAPNSVVVDVDRARGVLLVHRLAP